jgi:hypothetical protein
MFEPEIEYPYWQPEPPLPYQPNRGYTDPSRYSQQTVASPAAITQANVTRTRPVASARQQRPQQAQPTTPRMSKAEALEFVEQCKKWLVAGSVVAFSVLSGLVAGHVIGSSSQPANQSNNQAAPSFNSPSDDGGGGFFQQGGNNFGNGNGVQSPFSGSHTS